MTTKFFDISYDFVYDDTFNNMSVGKKAFVILLLPLDFSNKDCPILIDQPEDDLDNRAIYRDLVTYLVRKKKERQIILVTHNPNIVVGADSELIIVANQNGNDSPNKNGNKFQYVSGSLENSKEYNKNITITLESQGIKEHVCEILEGGNEAFKQRERKYAIKK
jgi:predicted ATP-dependent endonuclease of OLD family